MKNNYYALTQPENEYHKLINKTNQKIVNTGKGLFMSQEILSVNNLQIEIRFYLTKYGKVLGPIINTYFKTPDDPEILNRLGYNGYKKDLLERVIKDLEESRERNNETLDKVTR